MIKINSEIQKNYPLIVSMVAVLFQLVAQLLNCQTILFWVESSMAFLKVRYVKPLNPNNTTKVEIHLCDN